MSKKCFGIWVVLALIASSFLILYFHHSLQDYPEDTIQEQWRAIKDRELTKAYFAYTSKEYQDITSLKEFKELVGYLPIDGESLKLTELEDEYPYKVMEGIIQGIDPADLTLYYEMFFQNGAWKVDRMLLLEET